MGYPMPRLLWLGGDENCVPVAGGLGKPPTQVPAEHHASALANAFRLWDYAGYQPADFAAGFVILRFSDFRFQIF